MRQVTTEDALRGLENAVGILQLRLGTNEWGQAQGRKMAPSASDADLVKMVLTLAAGLLDEVTA